MVKIQTKVGEVELTVTELIEYEKLKTKETKGGYGDNIGLPISAPVQKRHRYNTKNRKWNEAADFAIKKYFSKGIQVNVTKVLRERKLSVCGSSSEKLRKAVARKGYSFGRIQHRDRTKVSKPKGRKDSPAVSEKKRRRLQFVTSRASQIMKDNIGKFKWADALKIASQEYKSKMEGNK